MPSPTTSLSIAQLAIYIPLLAPALYTTIKHGKRGLLAWIFLIAFCSLRLIGSGMSISNPKSTSAQIIAGVGLSPLVLCFVGLLHEVNSYTKSEKKPIWMKWPVQTALHLSVTTALALVVVGATSNGKDIALEKVGYIVFLGIWILISFFAFLSLKQDHSNALAQKLLFGTITALPFLGIRILYSTVAVFDTSINSQTGPLVYRVVLGVVMELLVVIVLLGFGIATRRVGRVEEKGEWKAVSAGLGEEMHGGAVRGGRQTYV